jgi:hypothetical protein
MEELGYEGWRKKYGDKQDGYNSGGYEWCCENWGTKWSACRVELQEQNERCVHLAFDTAWTPPIPVIAALHKKFPEATLEIEYFECGVGFCGGATWYSKLDAEDMGHEWEAGVPSLEWESKYRGSRGG